MFWGFYDVSVKHCHKIPSSHHILLDHPPLSQHWRHHVSYFPRLVAGTSWWRHTCMFPNIEIKLLSKHHNMLSDIICGTINQGNIQSMLLLLLDVFLDHKSNSRYFPIWVRRLCVIAQCLFGKFIPINLNIWSEALSQLAKTSLQTTTNKSFALLLI